MSKKPHLHSEQTGNDAVKIAGEVRWNAVEPSLAHSCREGLLVGGVEGRDQRTELIRQAAERPEVRALVIAIFS